jgi:hypothetical protein
VGWQSLTPSDRTEAADWIAERLHPFAKDVGSVIPPGFDAYARIFHPAWNWPNREEIEVRWSYVAAGTGRTVHPEMQFHAIADPLPGRETDAQRWNGEPRLGVLSAQQANALIALLSRHTSTPDRCWLCLWDGYGFLHPGSMAVLTSTYVGPPSSGAAGWQRAAKWQEHLFQRVGRRPGSARGAWPPKPPRPPRPPRQTAPKEPRVHLPSRDYILFNGAVEQAAGWENGPNLWWPEDRAWCVASEIDFPYTYVSGSSGLIEEVLGDPHLEALPARLDHGITYDSDKINS